MSHRVLKLVLLFAVAFSALPLLQAQDISSLTGLVTDSTGAIIKDASVVLVDTKTNTTYPTKTSGSGSYTITAIRPGKGYKVTISAAGFQSFAVDELAIGVGLTVTQNATLSVGASTTLEVSASNKTATLNTVDASIGNNLDVKILNELPVLNRDSVTVLFDLQPGVANGSVTGARTDQTETTVDGLDVNDIAAGQAGNGYQVISKAPVDSVEEFRGTVAGQLSSNGPGGGGQFQLVTKSGTNKFHGDINEYHRDAQLAANTYFNDLNKIAKPPYIQNTYGGAIGGPIFRDKAFFFYDFNQYRIIQSAAVLATVPLDSYRNGTVNYINNGPGCTSSSRLTTTPACISSLTPAQVATLDPQHAGANSALLAYVNTRYPHANDLSVGNGYNTGGFRFNAPFPNNQTTHVLRLDYNLTSTMKLFARGTINRRNGTQSAVRFENDPVSNPFVDRSYSYVAGHIWQIGSNKVNQFQYGTTVTEFNFPSSFRPTGTTSFTFSGLTNPFNSFSEQRRRVPVPEFRDDFNWTKGAHQLSFGGTFKPIKTNSLLRNDYLFPTIGLGGNTSTLNSFLRPTNLLNTTTAVGGYDTAFTFALGRVGTVSANYNYDNAGKALPFGTGAIRRYRYYQTEAYFGDSWKVNPSLTLTYGVRYQYYSVPFEAAGAQSEQNLGFDEYFKARQAQSAANASGTTTLPFFVYGLGGKANKGPDVYAPNYKDFAPRFAFSYNPASFRKLVVRGGAGLVYDRTVINAVNFIQDQSSYIFQQTGVVRPYGISGDATNSLLNDPRIGSNFGTNFNLGAAIAAPAPTIANPFTPNVTNGVPNGLAVGRGQNAIDTHLKDPYNITYNLGIQHELPAGFIMQINYVGRLGRRLLAQADVSQLLDTADPISGQSLSDAFTKLTLAARANTPTSANPTVHTVANQPFFENQGGTNSTQFLYNGNTSTIKLGDFADFVQAAAASGRLKPNVGITSQFAYNSFLTNKGFSSYNGILLTLQKNFSQGLRFDFNYTWSHSIDNTSLNANAIAANTGLGFVCDVVRPRECRGNSDFDVQTVVNSNFSYDLPVGRNRRFLSSAPVWLDEVIGGWQVAGIPQYRSGLAFGTTTGAFVAGYASNAPAIFNGNRAAVAAHLNKQNNTINLFTAGPAAGLQTGTTGNFLNPLGFDIGSRNNLRGPSVVQFDASLAKTFPLVGERVSAKFRADAFNVLNHPGFALPGTSNVNSGTFGQITGVSVAARILQVALRVEF